MSIKKIDEIIRLFLALVLSATTASSAQAAKQDQAPRIIVIKNVRVFDGEKVIDKQTVAISGNTVISVGGEFKPKDNAAVHIVDGSGRTLLPGLIDAHVHLWSADNLKQPLIFGVTALVDMFSPVTAIREIKKEQASGLPLPQQAYVVSPMTAVTAPKGHCTQYGIPIPTMEHPEEARDFVAARIAEGSDFIKIIYDDGSAYNFSMPTLKRETLKAVIQAAREQGKMSVIHAGTLKKCREALEDGVNGLAHLNFDDAFDPDFGQLAAGKKAFVIPTLMVLEAMNGHADALKIAADKHLAPFLKNADIQALKTNTSFKTSASAYPAAEKTLRQLRESGVPILAGTDAPNMGTVFGAALHGELELLVRAGLTPIEALRAATSLPAAKFGMRGRGVIREGSVADLVLVEGDPISDITATRSIVTVWKDGIPVDREGYLGEIQKERAAIEKQKNAALPMNLGNGLISDFEADKISANFGAGWIVSTDSFLGGKSKAQMSLIEDGANGSKRALLVKGTIADAGMIKFAGVLFSPGASFMAPANLSSKKVLCFWVKGDGPSFTVMIYSQSLGVIPRMKEFKVEKEWKEIRLSIADFNIDGRDIMGIFIGASNTAGDFSIQIDDVRLK